MKTTVTIEAHCGHEDEVLVTRQNTSSKQAVECRLQGGDVLQITLEKGEVISTALVAGVSGGRDSGAVFERFGSENCA